MSWMSHTGPHMEYVRGRNQLVLIMDRINREVLTKVARMVEGGVVLMFKEHILDGLLPPSFVQYKCCGM